jgi:hypothetical protein
MERHLIAGHPEYVAYQRQVVSPFFPWLARRQKEPLPRDGQGFLFQEDMPQ